MIGFLVLILVIFCWIYGGMAIGLPLTIGLIIFYVLIALVVEIYDYLQ